MHRYLLALLIVASPFSAFAAELPKEGSYTASSSQGSLPATRYDQIRRNRYQMEGDRMRRREFIAGLGMTAIGPLMAAGAAVWHPGDRVPKHTLTR